MHRPDQHRLAAGLIAGVGLVCALATSLTAAQAVNSDNPDWAESQVPAPPAFEMGKLLKVDVDGRGSLRYGVDPATIGIGKDGIVRYVIVAHSDSGAMTAMYEGIRCGTAEFRTYARYNGGQWRPLESSKWRSLFEPMPIKYPLAMARQGACDNSAPASSVQAVVRGLKDAKPADFFP